VVAIRPAHPDELALLPDLEVASDTLFLSLAIGPLPPPGTVDELRAALMVLVATVATATPATATPHPVCGFARIDQLAGGAHLEQLAVHPDHTRQGIGRELLRAACAWASAAGYAQISLATYRDVPWKGPFYASEGFRECGPADQWLEARGQKPEDPVMGRFGTRVVMSRPLSAPHTGSN
jgi:GNAT superfamily N-acetyltransferase